MFHSLLVFKTYGSPELGHEKTYSHKHTFNSD